MLRQIANLLTLEQYLFLPSAECMIDTIFPLPLALALGQAAALLLILLVWFGKWRVHAPEKRDQHVRWLCLFTIFFFLSAWRVTDTLGSQLYILARKAELDRQSARPEELALCVAAMVALQAPMIASIAYLRRNVNSYRRNLSLIHI